MSEPFSGSYQPAEVAFLMRRLHLKTTALDERERLIQSGQRHYSEMIGPEDAPTRARLRLFRECLAANGERMARDLSALAAAMAATAVNGELTVVSIARAGTPIGVLLWHRIRETAPHLRVTHYSISVIRDRGVDYAALRWIMARHAPASLRFVDGWTGKGTIADELQRSLGGWAEAPADLNPGLWVPLDVCGAAVFAASSEDYLIPSTLLGGTLSGLVSRSVLPAGEEDGMEFHGCVPLNSLRRYDLSRWFIREMRARLEKIPLPGSSHPPVNASGGPPRRAETAECLDLMLARHGMTDRNRIKLGIGETVRVLLRRKPHTVWLSPRANPTDADLIRRLAALRQVAVSIDGALTFDAVAVIATV
ncbi:MAG: cysteine protease StiP domain-containing protein [Verrucomicrobiota bacterium]